MSGPPALFMMLIGPMGGEGRRPAPEIRELFASPCSVFSQRCGVNTSTQACARSRRRLSPITSIAIVDA
jgi:hypothetical protein